MAGSLSETFFRPDEIVRERLNIPAPLYNQCRLMLARCQYDHVFVPIRTMQYQAVIDDAEVIFVDNLAYAVRNGEGGKLIRIAWQFCHHGEREDLNEPATIDLVYYDKESPQIQHRLIGEFTKALAILEERSKERGCEPRSRKILPFAKD